jgi:hypothetical protein
MRSQKRLLARTFKAGDTIYVRKSGDKLEFSQEGAKEGSQSANWCRSKS